MSEILKPTPEQLVAILADHAKYLRGETGGKRADLRGAYLSGADLRGADLSGAYLRSADLRGADLSGAYLSGADLRSAYLRSAYLRSAYLRSADLSGADLSGADLSGADLRGADLRSAYLRSAYLRSAYLRSANLSGADLSGADLSAAKVRAADLKDVKNGALSLAQTEILPREGEVIGWKRCVDGVLVKLRIPRDARRSNAPGGRKCRAEWAEVLEVVGAEVGLSIHDRTTEYRMDEVVMSDGWGDDRFIECAPGIHFFLTREEAEAYCS